MHIAFLTPEFPHPKVRASAGIGTSIKNLIEGIQNVDSVSSSFKEACVHQELKISVFVYGQTETTSWSENNITFHLIEHKKYRLGGFIRYRRYVNKYINRVIKRDAINLIEAPDWTGITAYMKFSIPLVIRLHGTDAYFCNLEGREQKKKNYHLEMKALLGADLITSVSKFTALETARIFNISNPIEVIHNAIDVSFFKPSKVKPKEDTILYFGSVIRKKGVLELAKSFKKVLDKKPMATLIYLGKDVRDVKEGLSTIQLIQDILGKDQAANVIFVSQVPYAKVKSYIEEASVICLPSHAEAFPMTWLEAMAMAKPMVTSDVGWASEIMIQEKTGLTVNPNKIDELAKALLFMLTNAKEASVYGEAARKHLITNFKPTDIGIQNLEFYQKALKA